MSGVARAQPAPPPDEPPAAPEMTPDEQRALALYEEGDRRYAEGRYEESVELFQQAYDLSPQPLLLFNMANSYERMAAYQQAADKLEAYINSATGVDAPADVDVLRQRLHQIRERAATQRGQQAELEQLRARPERCPDLVSCPVEVEPPGSSDRTAYVLFGTGGVALITAVVFGAMARSAGNSARESCASADGTRFCSSDARNEIDRERRFALAADISAGLGVAALGAGAYFFWRHRRDEQRADRSARIAPTTLGGGSFGVLVDGRF